MRRRARQGTITPTHSYPLETVDRRVSIYILTLDSRVRPGSVSSSFRLAEQRSVRPAASPVPRPPASFVRLRVRTHGYATATAILPAVPRSLHASSRVRAVTECTLPSLPEQLCLTRAASRDMASSRAHSRPLSRREESCSSSAGQFSLP